MFLVGLTGGIASGKSTVSSMFKNMNCQIIDADEVAGQVVQPGQPAWKLVVQKFGEDILLPNGEIDREKLGQIIFSDPRKRKILNNCTHPEIHKVMFWKILKLFLQGYRFVILDIPLLFESGVIAPFMNKIIVVYCDPDIQFQRLVKRNGYTEEHARERISAQIPLNEKCRKATHVVNNSESKTETLQQVKKIHEELISSRAYLPARITAVVASCALIFLSRWVVSIW